MKRIIIAALVAMTLAGCASPEDRQINDAKSRIRFLSSDPGTVEFRDLKVGMAKGEPTVCGYVNMKLKGETEMTGAVPFVVGRGEQDYWVETQGGNCEFDVLFQPCHTEADPKPWRERCDAQLAETARMAAETKVKMDGFLKCFGLTTTGDASRDHDAIMRALTARKFAPGMGLNSPECQP